MPLRRRVGCVFFCINKTITKFSDSTKLYRNVASAFTVSKLLTVIFYIKNAQNINSENLFQIRMHFCIVYINLTKVLGMELPLEKLPMNFVFGCSCNFRINFKIQRNCHICCCNTIQRANLQFPVGKFSGLQSRSQTFRFRILWLSLGLEVWNKFWRSRPRIYQCRVYCTSCLLLNSSFTHCVAIG